MPNKLPRGSTIIIVRSLRGSRMYKVRNSIINKFDSVDGLVTHIQGSAKKYNYLKPVGEIEKKSF